MRAHSTGTTRGRSARSSRTSFLVSHEREIKILMAVALSVGAVTLVRSALLPHFPTTVAVQLESLLVEWKGHGEAGFIAMMDTVRDVDLYFRNDTWLGRTWNFGLTDHALIFGPAIVYWGASLLLVLLLHCPVYSLSEMISRVSRFARDCTASSSENITSKAQDNNDNNEEDHEEEEEVIVSRANSWRLQPPGMEDKNRVSCLHVILTVLSQHVIMLFVQAGFAVLSGSNPWRPLTEEPLLVKGFRFFIAMIYTDTHNYWMHRLMHENRWLYENIHSWHHRLHCPYPFGALYNHPLEGVLMDALGGAIALELSGMDGPSSALWVNCAYLKTVLDHSNISVAIPFFAPTTFHDFHHRPQGFRFNYQQPFFTFWDDLCGTAWDGSAAGRRAHALVERLDAKKWGEAPSVADSPNYPVPSDVETVDRKDGKRLDKGGKAIIDGEEGEEEIEAKEKGPSPLRALVGGARATSRMVLRMKNRFRNLPDDDAI